MSNVRRVYVEKKPAFAVKAKELKHEIKHYLGISTVTAVRELIRYDVENISDEVFEKACKTVFAEPPVDDLYLEKLLEKNPAPDKEADPMAWTAHMNALMATAEESILTELVYS